eukprot:648111-Hanusia_phi.AAC.1
MDHIDYITSNGRDRAVAPGHDTAGQHLLNYPGCGRRNGRPPAALGGREPKFLRLGLTGARPGDSERPAGTGRQQYVGMRGDE